MHKTSLNIQQKKTVTGQEMLLPTRAMVLDLKIIPDGVGWATGKISLPKVRVTLEKEQNGFKI